MVYVEPGGLQNTAACQICNASQPCQLRVHDVIGKGSAGTSVGALATSATASLKSSYSTCLIATVQAQVQRGQVQAQASLAHARPGPAQRMVFVMLVICVCANCPRVCAQYLLLSSMHAHHVLVVLYFLTVRYSYSLLGLLGVTNSSVGELIHRIKAVPNEYKLNYAKSDVCCIGRLHTTCY